MMIAVNPVLSARRVGTMRSAAGRGAGRRGENVAFARAVVSATGAGAGSGRRGRGAAPRAARGGAAGRTPVSVVLR